MSRESTSLGYRGGHRYRAGAAARPGPGTTFPLVNTETLTDANHADALIGAWLFTQLLAGRLATGQLPIRTALALDGKTLKGSWIGENTATNKVRLFSALVHGEGVIVGQREIPSNTNEITQMLPLLDTLAQTCQTDTDSVGAGPPDPGGAVITADALHVHRDNVQGILDRGAEYVLTVKNNGASGKSVGHSVVG